MDIHKESIVTSLADDNRNEIHRYGSTGETIDDFKIMLRVLTYTGEVHLSLINSTPHDIAVNNVTRGNIMKAPEQKNSFGSSE